MATTASWLYGLPSFGASCCAFKYELNQRKHRETGSVNHVNVTVSVAEREKFNPQKKFWDQISLSLGNTSSLPTTPVKNQPASR